MKPITIFLTILLISLIVITCIPYTSTYEDFVDTVNNDININLRLNNNHPQKSQKPRVMVPLYAPWRMYYPYESVYSNPIPWQYQSSPFYPFFDQYNIYQNMLPW
jgi:hypothetical protein